MTKNLTFILLTLLLTACGKLPSNGDLDGKWMLTAQYTKPSTDSPTYSDYTDKRDAGISWNVQLDLLTITAPVSLHEDTSELQLGKSHEVVCRFNHEGSTLRLTQIFWHYRAHDIAITPEELETSPLSTVGIHQGSTDFQVLQLSSKRMVLCSETDSLIFKKI